MKQVIKYQAFDGTEFVDDEECQKYEKFERTILEIASQLPSRPEDDGCAFSNGAGYIQHEALTVVKVRNELLRKAQELSKHKWFQETIDSKSFVHPSWAGRIIGELSSRALNAAWDRISCIDKQCREWGQPYFVEHSTEAENKCLNP